MNCPYLGLVDWQQCSEDCRDRAVASNAYKKFPKRLAMRVFPKSGASRRPFLWRAFLLRDFYSGHLTPPDKFLH